MEGAAGGAPPQDDAQAPANAEPEPEDDAQTQGNEQGEAETTPEPEAGAQAEPEVEEGLRMLQKEYVKLMNELTGVRFGGAIHAAS